MDRIEFAADERVALTPLEESDLPTVVRWINNQQVIQFLGGPLGLSLDEERKWLERMRASDSDIIFGVWLRSEKQLIGTVALHGVRGYGRHAEYGVSIGKPEFWGQGYGTEAGRLILDYGFNRINLNSIFLRVFAENLRGVRSYEKMGFKMAGTLRQHAYRDGHYCDMHYMDILRDEFNQLWDGWRLRQRERYGMG